MLIHLLSLALGLAFLVLSADKFVDAAAKLASWLKVPPLVIGVLILGFGTSAPEILVSILAALEEKSSLALGNAYGSNIANIGLVLGLSLLISPVVLTKTQLKQDYLFLLLITLLTLGLLTQASLGLLPALLLLAIFLGYVGATFLQALKSRDAQPPAPNQLTSANKLSNLAWLVASLAVLLASSKLLVWAAIQLALGWGINELTIGLTLIAIGTSLPELAASIAAVRKGEQELVIGNLLGSNIFNTLAVVGIAGVLHPINITSDILWRDGLVMLGFTLTLALLAWLNPKKIYSLGLGLIFLVSYSCYLFSLF